MYTCWSRVTRILDMYQNYIYYIHVYLLGGGHAHLGPVPRLLAQRIIELRGGERKRVTVLLGEPHTQTASKVQGAIENSVLLCVAEKLRLPFSSR